MQNIDCLLVKPRLDYLAGVFEVVLLLKYPGKWQIIGIFSRLIVNKDKDKDKDVPVHCFGKRTPKKK